MPDPVSAITGGLSLIRGMNQADAAQEAADSQLAASREGIAENRRQFDLVQQLLKPYVDAGGRGLTSYENLLGTSTPDAQQKAIQALQAGPQYGALVKAGEDAILANASATGGLRGGNVQNALATNRQRVLASLINDQLTRTGQLATVGQNSAAGVGNAALGTGSNIAALLQQGGAANAGGIIAGSNAITKALGGVGGLVAARGLPTGSTSVVGPGYSLGDPTVLPTGDFARMDRAF